MHCAWRRALSRGRQMISPCRSSKLSSFLSSVDGMRMVVEGFGCSLWILGVVFAVCAGVDGLYFRCWWFGIVLVVLAIVVVVVVVVVLGD